MRFYGFYMFISLITTRSAISLIAVLTVYLNRFSHLFVSNFSTNAGVICTSQGRLLG